MTLINRRSVLKSGSLTVGSLALTPFLERLRAEERGALPKRFVFINKSNGLKPYGIQPPGLKDFVRQPGDKSPAQQKEGTFQRTLKDQELHPTMAALAPFKEKMNIIQGLSAKMCAGSHGASWGGLGAYRLGAHEPPAAETIDGVLSRELKSIFPHLGFAMDAPGKLVVYPRLSALGKNKPMSFYADPIAAYKDLFAVVSGGDVKKQADLDRNLLDYMIEDIKRLNGRLTSSEKEKLGHYLEGFEALRERGVKLSQAGDLAKYAPELDDKYRSETETHRLEAHFDMAAASLIAGLTNVVTFSLDDLDQRYTGLDLGEKTVHQIGHLSDDFKKGRDTNFSNGMDGVEARDLIRKFHFDLIANLAEKLNRVPEGGGTMLDNTLIVYFSVAGGTHHPNFMHWPIVTLGGLGGSIKRGQYVHYAEYDRPGHGTIGAFYTTLFHAAGLPREGFGQVDLRLNPSVDQKAPLGELLA